MAKVLIIDDDAVCCDSLEVHLEKQGHEVYTASTVQKGIAVLQKSSADGMPFEVVIIDLRFGQNATAGMEAFKIACEIPLLQRIILTGHGSLENAKCAITGGIFAYIEKPKGVSSLNERSTLAEVAVAVSRASAQRELFISLQAAYRGLRDVVNQLRLTDCNPDLLKFAEEFLSLAEQAYRTVKEEAAYLRW